MVNVIDKNDTRRKATAKAVMFLGKEVMSGLEGDEIRGKKGPVFQTAIIAGIQAVKKTSELIPMCHPLLLDGISIAINPIDEVDIEIVCSVEMEGKTGVEMEALTGASIASLTIYDMCKAVSQHMSVKKLELIEKSGGKRDIKK
jgi:cyclic pyranopterin phosphate synthase